MDKRLIELADILLLALSDNKANSWKYLVDKKIEVDAKKAFEASQLLVRMKLASYPMPEFNNSVLMEVTEKGLLVINQGGVKRYLKDEKSLHKGAVRNAFLIVPSFILAVLAIIIALSSFIFSIFK